MRHLALWTVDKSLKLQTKAIAKAVVRHHVRANLLSVEKEKFPMMRKQSPPPRRLETRFPTMRINSQKPTDRDPRSIGPRTVEKMRQRHTMQLLVVNKIRHERAKPPPLTTTT
ncbi:uncharacterized protein [Bemisia tabaci]|uniref:uncharacterized protein n=1 Tax=Bemisia tabaci TaxID=7038 RepID=UPI003B27B3D5